LLIASCFEKICITYEEQELKKTAQGEDTDPPFDHPVGDETLLGVVEPHIQDVQAPVIGKNLSAECQGDPVLLLVHNILFGIEFDLHRQHIRQCRMLRKQLTAVSLFVKRR